MMDGPEEFAGPVNVGNPDEFTMLELAKLVLNLTGSAARIVNLSLPPDDPRQRKPDISLARRKLNWAPSIGLEMGLSKTIAYFRKVLARGSPIRH